MSAIVIGYAIVGGFLPPLLWLYFLLKEDSRCPEPRSMIIGTFIVGMLVLPLVIPFQQYICSLLQACPIVEGKIFPQPVALWFWSAFEELFKYAAVAAFVLWRRSVDESIDYVVYMITAALGFAALENALFLLGPLMNGEIANSVVTGNIRFIGASLLHVVASSLIGFALGFSFMKPRIVRIAYVVGGVILAITLHALFNILIISGEASKMFQALFTVWCAAIVFFALFEILKYIRYRQLPKNTC